MAANIESILAKVRRYNPETDSVLLRRAHDYATEKHSGQFRKTGEPYIKHPVEVVDILAGLEMDDSSLAAGFLHGQVTGRSIEQSLRLGAICAAECIGHMGPRPVADLKALAGGLA